MPTHNTSGLAASDLLEVIAVHLRRPAAVRRRNGGRNGHAREFDGAARDDALQDFRARTEKSHATGAAVERAHDGGEVVTAGDAWQPAVAIQAARDERESDAISDHRGGGTQRALELRVAVGNRERMRIRACKHEGTPASGAIRIHCAQRTFDQLAEAI